MRTLERGFGFPFAVLLYAAVGALAHGVMAIEAWYMDEDKAADQRLPHRQSPNVACGTAELESLGERER